jgi:hypothetical protein
VRTCIACPLLESGESTGKLVVLKYLISGTKVLAHLELVVLQY